MPESECFSLNLRSWQLNMAHQLSNVMTSLFNSQAPRSGSIFNEGCISQTGQGDACIPKHPDVQTLFEYDLPRGLSSLSYMRMGQFWIELKKMGLKTRIAWKLHLLNAYRRINPHKQRMSVSIRS